ncbi:Putative anti-sigma factor antagonist [Sulfitobacter sp. THAF37]|uniref:STAS domain-containing protein n=1 Tax=Sulfitobacter sp. THAF37 TaxID=2587855 RepID=UPI001267F47A|nr:STAS domain-containing protein [Sulfitobacter sp. THAF37]QFT58523.1 Putative anti-sigma factor antagonist [Sulfitobacter sp. THAF37]
MEVSTKTEDGFCVVTLHEARIDAAVALDFKETMRRATEGGPARVILDLGVVTFVDSSGLGAIVATMKFLAPDRTLILAGLTPPVDKVFRLTRMDSVFSIFSTLDDALTFQRA